MIFNADYHEFRFYYKALVTLLFFDVLCRQKAGVKLDGGSYLIHKIYSDAETLKLVGTACEVLGIV